MNRRRRVRRRLLLILLMLIVLAAALFVQLRFAPFVREAARTRVINVASDRINDTINEQIAVGCVDYSNIICLEKDARGAITAVRTNMAEVNQLKTETLALLSRELLEMDTEQLYIPLGSVLPVRGTAFDFTAPRCVCRTPGEEYDINFVLRGEHAATLEGARSGLKMEMYTDMPCIQLYSGAADMDVAGKTRRYHAHEGVALEPQFAPNAVNVPAFKQPFLAAGKEERHFIRLEF